MGSPEIIILVGLWATVAFCLMILSPLYGADGQIEAHNVVFWPIALLKWLLRQLYLVLFTGWKQ